MTQGSFAVGTERWRGGGGACSWDWSQIQLLQLLVCHKELQASVKADKENVISTPTHKNRPTKRPLANKYVWAGHTP